MSKATRVEWVKRVERWRDSGLTAKEFAAELDVFPSSLTYWKVKLGRERGAEGKQDVQSAQARPESGGSEVPAARSHKPRRGHRRAVGVGAPQRYRGPSAARL
jgi:hypothetical protein